MPGYAHPPAPSYAVTFEDVATTSVDLAAAADDVGAELQRLASAMAAALDTDWQGVAATAFAADWRDWYAAAVRAGAALAALGALLGASGAAYEQTEDAVRAAAS